MQKMVIKALCTPDIVINYCISIVCLFSSVSTQWKNDSEPAHTHTHSESEDGIYLFTFVIQTLEEAH